MQDSGQPRVRSFSASATSTVTAPSHEILQHQKWPLRGRANTSQHKVTCLVAQDNPPIIRSASVESQQPKKSPKQRNNKTTRYPLLSHKTAIKKHDDKSRLGAESTNSQQPNIGESVKVDTSSGIKFGTVKFIGSTKFAKGKLIGVALTKPEGESQVCYRKCHMHDIVTILGEHNGTLNGVEYFKCKDKHGLFVREDKISIRQIASYPQKNSYILQ